VAAMSTRWSELKKTLIYCFFGILILLGWVWDNMKYGSFIRRAATVLGIAGLIALLILKPLIFLILLAIFFVVLFLVMLCVIIEVRKEEQEKEESRREFEKEYYRNNGYYNQNRSYEKSSYERKNSNNNRTATNTAKTSFFEGMTMDEAKKEFRRLIKIYHPDNQGGSLEMSQKITSEYEKFRTQHQS
jgi:predicted membrane protein